ncbi:MAG TPA: histidine kinase N-terminal 7TM domain-containing protein [Prolixibacteraceae bacterium]|nr:histidine kinase N-terminal 7TM domain-containing protein [Prolixibacteraceae bacterium]
MGHLDINLISYHITPLFILLLLGGVIAIITFFFLLKLKKTSGVKFWMGLQIAAAIWAFTYAFEFAANTIETKIFWSRLSYFGIVYCPVFFLFFTLAFASRYRYLKKKIVIAVFGFATLFILFPFTNDLHHLHWISYSINPITHATNYVYGPLFWIMTFFAYVALALGIINIFLMYFRMSDYYRKQITLLLFAALLPPTGNLIYIFHINPVPGFDWTPFTFIFTGLLVAINLSHFNMFELVPVARDILIDNIHDAIMVVDNSLVIADLNPAMQKIIGSDKKELIGSSAMEVFPHRETLIQEILKGNDYQAKVSREIDGVTHFFDMQVTSLFDHNRNQTGRLVVLKDITRHIVAEEKNQEANLRLMDEIREKEKLIVDLDSFSHTVAHDLKNMLGAIVSASNLIKQGIDDMEKEELLEINELIRQAATKTMHITRELLTLASVRQQEVKLVKVNMHRVVIDALSRLNDMTLEYNAKIVIPDSFYEALGYDGWLEEVWINYISNAIKYGGTPPVIQLGSELLADGKVKYWIKDNGKGLSAEDMALLFNKFTRLDTLRVEGNGLGLSIVKRIVEKLNGEVGVESKNIVGEGCTFYFILPQPSAE